MSRRSGTKVVAAHVAQEGPQAQAAQGSDLPQQPRRARGPQRRPRARLPARGQRPRCRRSRWPAAGCTSAGSFEVVGGRRRGGLAAVARLDRQARRGPSRRSREGRGDQRAADRRGRGCSRAGTLQGLRARAARPNLAILPRDGARSRPVRPRGAPRDAARRRSPLCWNALPCTGVGRRSAAHAARPARPIPGFGSAGVARRRRCATAREAAAVATRPRGGLDRRRRRRARVGRGGNPRRALHGKPARSTRRSTARLPGWTASVPTARRPRSAGARSS